MFKKKKPEKPEWGPEWCRGCNDDELMEKLEAVERSKGPKEAQKLRDSLTIDHTPPVMVPKPEYRGKSTHRSADQLNQWVQEEAIPDTASPKKKGWWGRRLIATGGGSSRRKKRIKNKKKKSVSKSKKNKKTQKRKSNRRKSNRRKTNRRKTYR